MPAPGTCETLLPEGEENKEETPGSIEMAQWIKCLLDTYEDLRSLIKVRLDGLCLSP